MKVLNFGSLNIDYVYKVEHFVQKGETISSDSLNIFCGGKGLNQSVALGRAGVEVCHAGAIGKDGQFLLEVLRESSVNVDRVKVLNHVNTGSAVIQNDQEGDNCIILYGGANRAVTRELVDDTLARFEAGDYLLIQNEINELEYIVDRAYEKGMKIVFNPAPMNEAALKLAFHKLSVLFVNEVEGAQILGADQGSLPGDMLLKALMRKFPELQIVLTLGDEGSVYGYKEQVYKQKIYPAKVVDTTAAGDTYIGYFMAEVIGGRCVQEAMDTASRAASVTVARSGAAPSIPYRAEVV